MARTKTDKQLAFDIATHIREQIIQLIADNLDTCARAGFSRTLSVKLMLGTLADIMAKVAVAGDVDDGDLNEVIRLLRGAYIEEKAELKASGE